MKKSLLLVILFSSFQSFSQSFNVGDVVMAFENDDALWYKATILSKVDILHYKIHWEGFSSDYDEEVHVEKLWKEGQDYVVNDRLQGLETDGKWYNVKVLKRDIANKKYFIHWGGFADEYDRWISYDSLRLPTKANEIKEGQFQSSFNYGTSGSSVTIKNKCGGKAYFYIPAATGMGTYKHEAIAGNGSKTVSLSNGEEIWLSNEKREKIALLYTGGSSSGSEVILCK